MPHGSKTILKSSLNSHVYWDTLYKTYYLIINWCYTFRILLWTVVWSLYIICKHFRFMNYVIKMYKSINLFLWLGWIFNFSDLNLSINLNNYREYPAMNRIENEQTQTFLNKKITIYRKTILLMIKKIIVLQDKIVLIIF